MAIFRNIFKLTSINALLILSACGDDCSNYSKYSCDQIERADYNVYYYLPDRREEYLGEAKGLKGCSALAANYSAITKTKKDWICCMKTNKSQCEEKHR